MKRVRDSERVSIALSDDQVTFTFEDGASASAPPDTVCGSSVLRDVLCDTSDGQEGAIAVPRGILQAWVQSTQQDNPFQISFLQARTLGASACSKEGYMCTRMPQLYPRRSILLVSTRVFFGAQLGRAVVHGYQRNRPFEQEIVVTCALLHMFVFHTCVLWEFELRCCLET